LELNGLSAASKHNIGKQQAGGRLPPVDRRAETRKQFCSGNNKTTIRSFVSVVVGGFERRNSNRKEEVNLMQQDVFDVLIDDVDRPTVIITN
jgi:hypothetical protein